MSAEKDKEILAKARELRALVIQRNLEDAQAWSELEERLAALEERLAEVLEIPVEE